MFSKKIDCLFNALWQAEIKFIHWKSNLKIDKALNLDTDLDILFPPNSFDRVSKILINQGLIRVISPKDKWQNGIYHFYGYDYSIKKIIHVHAHFELNIGNDYSKNIKIPSKLIIENSIPHKNIFITKPEDELILLINRIVLKYNISYVNKSPFKKFNLLDNDRLELKDLFEKTTKESLILRFQELNLYDLDFFIELINFFKSREKKRFYWIYLLNIKLYSRLKNFTEKSYLIYLLHTIKRKIQFKILKTNYNKLANGKLIAFIGLDGSGKSTNINSSYDFFSKITNTNKYHFGKIQSKFLSILIRAIAFLLRKMFFSKSSVIFKQICLGLYRLYIISRSKKEIRKGSLVMLDRFYLKGMKLMDSPNLYQKQNVNQFWADIEKKLYDYKLYPDLTIILTYNNQDFKQRRPEDNEQLLLSKSKEIDNLIFGDLKVVKINSSKKTFDETLQIINNEILKIIGID